MIIKLITNILLSTIARILYIAVQPINFIVVMSKGFTLERICGYFLGDATAIDRFGNYNFRTLWNSVLITKDSKYKFGDFRETISSVLGKNMMEGTLSNTGLSLAWILDLIDKNHCIKSIKWYD